MYGQSGNRNSEGLGWWEGGGSGGNGGDVEVLRLLQKWHIDYLYSKAIKTAIVPRSYTSGIFSGLE